MAHTPPDRGLDQRSGIHRVVAVVAKRIADRVGHDDRGGEMDDGVDLVFCNQRRYLRLVPAVTDDEHGPPRHRPIETGGEIVEHHHPLAGIDERMNHVAADITGAAGDQDRHAVDWLLNGPSSLREALRLQAVLDALMVGCARGLSRSFSSNAIRDALKPNVAALSDG